MNKDNPNFTIIDVNACYKSIDENTISALLEIKRKDSSEYEVIFKYTFSINKLEKNSIEVYNDLKLSEIYNIYELLKKNPNYKGVFDIYFRVYQNELNNLRQFAIEKMNELNNPKVEVEDAIEQVKDTAKKFFQELWEEGSTNEKNGSIIRVAAYKKECPKEKIGLYANRYAIDIIRYSIDAWENIFSHEYGKYKTAGVLMDVDCVSVYKVLSEEEIFKILSLLHTDEEYEVVSKYLKMVPKEPHGESIPEKIDDKPPIENIKFL